ncbi:hypothetical protein [Jiulongibacter sediminis]|jgi:hypothetical protein|uniref:Uncharacterized protein n=1 Tax=Jiulongibacter sediminis TaxID=1605367 RepID=A0A0P7BJC0_9BACT|nr:hypothetical protein [Jiulongibacter sediminis]KPM47291.1 hypothetical protein AFM12_15965 [Jiulongibacter sediminis]TBX22849.1 hypothetical protein TK44_15975 [Jiulongibacter sediminis]
MTQTFTTKFNEVIRYVYNETSSTENLLIEESLTQDEELLDFYLDCLNLKSEMDKIQLIPSEKSISNVLAFSRNYEPVI